MLKTEPWQFERTIKGRRYVGLAWHPDKRWTQAVAALFTLKFEVMWPDLPVRKIPATADREEMYMIFIPDFLDTKTLAAYTDEERDIYIWLGNKIPKFLGG